MQRNNHSLLHFALLVWLLLTGNALAATEYSDVWVRETLDINKGQYMPRGFFHIDKKSEIELLPGSKEVVLLLDPGSSAKFGLIHEVMLIGFFSGKRINGTVVKQELAAHYYPDYETETYNIVVKTNEGKRLLLTYKKVFPKGATADKRLIETGSYDKVGSMQLFEERNNVYAYCETAIDYFRWNDFYNKNTWDMYILVKTQTPINRKSRCPYLGNEPFDFPDLTSNIDAAMGYRFLRLDDDTALVELGHHIVRLRLRDGGVPETMADHVVTVAAEHMHRFKTELRERMRKDGRLKRYDAFQIINDEIEQEFFGLHQPGFDCKLASSRVEKLICDDVVLSQLDAQLNQLYKQARAQPEHADTLRSTQRAWIKKRNSCMDRKCLEQSYGERIEVIDALLKQGAESNEQ